MKLSIIIAMFNTELYIEKCIRSVFMDSLIPKNDYEVIVINDGSTDSSRNIVEGLMSEFQNLTLINKENGGQSSARNIGFNLAKGKYIFCLDSDDFVDAGPLADALNYCIKNDLDMLPIFNRTFDESYIEIKGKEDIYPVLEKPISGAKFMKKFVVSGSMWRYFYKVSIFRDNNLLLTEGIYHEDEEFIVKFLSYVKKIAYRRHLVYNHLVRHNSTVNKKNKEHRVKLLNDLITVLNHLNIHRDKFSKISEEYAGITKKVEQLNISIFLRMKKDELNYEEIKPFVDKLKDLNLYPINVPNLDFKFKMAARMFNTKLFNKIYFS